MTIVSLTTDFGVADSYVAEMKAAILSVESRCRILDVTHAIELGAIREAAWVVATTWRAFPRGSIHVAVVDPEVGSARRALALRVEGHCFLAPDNGLLSPMVEEATDVELREIDRAHRTPGRFGTTFDGRELFGPVAGRLAAGLPFAEVGPCVHGLVELESFHPTRRDDGWRCEIVRIDRFGNLVTSATADFLYGAFGDGWRELAVQIGSREVRGVTHAFASVGEGDLVLTIGSADTLEISRRGGSAADFLTMRRCDLVILRPPTNPLR